MSPRDESQYPPHDITTVVGSGLAPFELQLGPVLHLEGEAAPVRVPATSLRSSLVDVAIRLRCSHHTTNLNFELYGNQRQTGLS